MRNKFKAEDDRKTLLFDAWNSFFENKQLQTFPKQDFDQFYEGLAQVSEVTTNSMTIRLQEAVCVSKFQITEQISKQTRAEDLIYIVIGRRGQKWLPLDLVSVGTLIPGKGNEAGFHLTINPLYMQSEPIH